MESLAPLRYVLLVAELGTFTKAAAKAHITQPALTTSIKKLEAELGAMLFERGDRHQFIMAVIEFPHFRI
jgi:DNA-binding transcriptional LysR family regulator